VKNINYLPAIIADSKLTFIPTAGYALDTMLWTTGFLMTYMLLADLQELPKLNWVEVYLHRLWRMFPLVAFVLFLTWILFPYFGTGPMWFSYADYSSNCHEDWWTNLLFINNFFPGDKYSSCFVVSYYISLEIQFFLITPLLLYLYRRWGAMTAWLGALLLIMIGLVTSYEVASIYDLNTQETSASNKAYEDYYYYRPYTRVPPYAWGLFCALVVFGYDNRMNRKTDRAAVAVGKIWANQYVAIVSFVMGIGLVTFCVFIQHTALKQGGPQFTYWTPNENYVFITFNRWFFSIGVSGIVVPITLGALRWPSQILSFSVWAPFSRLTYSCYLISYNLCLLMMLSQNASFYIDYMSLLQNALVFVFLSYVAGLCVCLLVEIPVLSLEKLFVQSRHSLLA
jgi:peptidoglycan/LPS O-acetylase OafA/YrhL